MPTNLSDIITLLFLAFSVSGLTTAIFGNVFVNWLNHILEKKINKSQLMRLDWEITMGHHYNVEAVKQRDRSLSPPLTEAEIEDRIKLQAKLKKQSRLYQVLAKPLRCSFCQSVYVSFALTYLTHYNWYEIIVYTFGLAAVTTLVIPRLTAIPQQKASTGCGSKKGNN